MNSIKIDTPVVSVAWLNKHRKASNIIILDGTINKVFNPNTQQIPHSRLFDIKKKFSNTNDPFPSAFPSIDLFKKSAQELGINNDSAIVVYDDKGIYSSARVWWLFKAFGYNNVAVLDGGFPEWQNQNLPTTDMQEYKGNKGNFTPIYKSKYMCFFNDMRLASKQKTHHIIDARSKDRFNCLVPEPRAGLRMGTIPNSINLPFTELLHEGKFKSKQEIEHLFRTRIPNKADATIISCGSGLTACVVALAAELVAYTNMTVYDGSWTEWGSLVDA